MELQPESYERVNMVMRLLAYKQDFAAVRAVRAEAAKQFSSNAESLVALSTGILANPNIELDTFTGEEYALMTLDSEGRTFTANSDNDGSVWMIIGTDSGFEGPTTVYYDRILITVVEE